MDVFLRVALIEGLLVPYLLSFIVYFSFERYCGLIGREGRLLRFVYRNFFFFFLKNKFCPLPGGLALYIGTSVLTFIRLFPLLDHL